MPVQTRTKISLFSQLVPGSIYICDGAGQNGSNFENWFDFTGQPFVVESHPGLEGVMEVVDGKWRPVYRTVVDIKVVNGDNRERRQTTPVICLGIPDQKQFTTDRDAPYLRNTTYLLG